MNENFSFLFMKDGGFVELGAQFIHGEKGNHLYDLAKKYGCLMGKFLTSDLPLCSFVEEGRRSKLLPSSSHTLQTCFTGEHIAFCPSLCG